MADQVVTIEGSLTPTAELPRGVRKTVLYTDRIQRLANKGYIKIIDGPRDADFTAKSAATGPVVEAVPSDPPADHTGVTLDDPHVDPLPTGSFAPADPFHVPQAPDESAQHEAVDHVQTAEHPTG